MSPCRRAIRRRMVQIAAELGPQRRVLEIGIAGDDPPGANREFFHAETYRTADMDPALAPDYVLDITALPASNVGAWDLVICSQVLEHVWDLEAAARGLWGLTVLGGVCIVDVPMDYPPHDEQGGGPDYWRIMPTGLKRLLRRAGFGRVECWAADDMSANGAVAWKELAR